MSWQMKRHKDWLWWVFTAWAHVDQWLQRNTRWVR